MIARKDEAAREAFGDLGIATRAGELRVDRALAAGRRYRDGRSDFAGCEGRRAPRHRAALRNLPPG